MFMQFVKVVLLAALHSVVCIGTLWAHDDAPWTFEQPLANIPRAEFGQPLRESTGFITRMLDFGIGFFQQRLSPLDGPKCPHYPTCSQFARESLVRYGPVWAVLMTTNRLQREYPGLLEGGNYHLVFIGRWRSLDPSDNAWLWSHKLTHLQAAHTSEHQGDKP